MAKLKTAGLWVEKSERTSVRVDVAELSDEDLMARIAATERDVPVTGAMAVVKQTWAT